MISDGFVPIIRIEKSWEIRGPALWAELHSRAKTYDGDIVIEGEWLDEFSRRIGCGRCKSDWLTWLRDNPPDLASAATYYIWTVESHNAVNIRLGKRAWNSPSFSS